MAFMQWSSELELHIAEIDRQHQRLVELINQFDDSVQAQHGADMLDKVLNELLDYTQTHFTYEESLLSKHGYPMHPEHKAEHEALAEKVMFMQNMFKEGNPPDSAMLLNFLKIWLKEHILDLDKQYAPFLLEKGVS